MRFPLEGAGLRLLPEKDPLLAGPERLKLLLGAGRDILERDMLLPPPPLPPPLLAWTPWAKRIAKKKATATKTAILLKLLI